MKKCLGDNVFGLKCGKSRLFSKAGLALGLGLGLAFDGVKMSTFDGPDGVQGWESAGKKTYVFLDKFGPQSMKKVDFFKS